MDDKHSARELKQQRKQRTLERRVSMLEWENTTLKNTMCSILRRAANDIQQGPGHTATRDTVTLVKVPNSDYEPPPFTKEMMRYEHSTDSSGTKDGHRDARSRSSQPVVDSFSHMEPQEDTSKVPADAVGGGWIQNSGDSSPYREPAYSDEQQQPVRSHSMTPPEPAAEPEENRGYALRYGHQRWHMFGPPSPESPRRSHKHPRTSTPAQQDTTAAAQRVDINGWAVGASANGWIMAQASNSSWPEPPVNDDGDAGPQNHTAPADQHSGPVMPRSVTQLTARNQPSSADRISAWQASANANIIEAPKEPSLHVTPQANAGWLL
ncbi:hypothetical protein GGF46_002790 [Coemansia sp. RSA 552]|nr:hypothetical protein GGF46_002872 [Coemansia sp. RSA 552]KAJ2159751.1 hypothetical protein GGF46_002790 [Coemansia sp. RSA 552]